MSDFYGTAHDMYGENVEETRKKIRALEEREKKLKKSGDPADQNERIQIGLALRGGGKVSKEAYEKLAALEQERAKQAKEQAMVDKIVDGVKDSLADDPYFSRPPEPGEEEE